MGVSKVFCLTVLAMCMALTACATTKVSNIDKDQMLVERVEAWSQARIDQDVLGAYELIWSGYKEIVPLGDYLKYRTGLGKLRDYYVEEVRLTEEGNEATVILNTSFDSFGFDVAKRLVEQVWVWEDGNWFIRLEPMISTPFGRIPIKRGE